MRSVHKIVAVYVTCYLLATLADAASTAAAMQSGAGEFNPHVADEAGLLHRFRFLIVNALILAFTSAMLAWAWNRRDRIDARLLHAPWRGLYDWATYLNPFSARNIPKSALHYMAAAPALLALKLFATVNNTLIHAGIPDVVTPLSHAVLARFDGTLAFWIVIFILWQPFWLGALYAVTRLLRRECEGSLGRVAGPDPALKA